MAEAQPISRHQSNLSSRPTIAMVRQPAIRANCPTSCPTPPDAAETTTVSNGRGRPRSKRPKYAVSPGIPMLRTIGHPGGDLMMALKSGNFGDVNFFAEALAKLV